MGPLPNAGPHLLAFNRPAARSRRGHGFASACGRARLACAYATVAISSGAAMA